MKKVFLISFLISLVIITIIKISKSKASSVSKKIKLVKNDSINTSHTPTYQSEQYHSISEIPTETGYRRVLIDTGSFAEYLRGLSFKSNHSKVLLYDGSEKKSYIT